MNIKKNILFILILFITSITYSNTLNNVSYKNDEIILTFTESVDKVGYKIKYESSTYLMQVDFTNININKKNIKTTMNIEDKLIDTIIIDSLNNSTSIYVYAQEQIDFNISKKSTKELVIKIRKESEEKKRKKTIVLDAGHGGKDSGAIGNSYYEKDLALATVLELKKLLEKDYNVILTRDDDFFVTLTDRAKIANDNNSDLFVSIHLNSATNTTASGTEVFYFSKNQSSYAKEIAKYENDFDKTSTLAIESSQFLLNDINYHSNQVLSAALATDVLDNIIDTVGPLRRRGVFGANFAVLRGTKSPAILIELGFISNVSDVSIFEQPEMRRKASEAIARAIRKHFN